MGHISGASTLLSGGNGVTSTNDGDGTLLLGEVSENVDNAHSSGSELLEFKDTHRSVHDDGLAVRKVFLLFFGRLGTVVKSHPSIRDLIRRNDLGFGILIELVGNDNIGRKKDLLSKLLGLGHDFLGGLDEVVLHQRVSNIESLGLEEGEDHTSTDDDLVTLVKECFKDGNLGRDLGSTDNGGHGLLSILDGTVKVFELLGEQVSSNRRLEELGDTLGGGVGTVGRTERVVHVEVEGGSELLDESRFVLGLLLVESGVFEHDDITLLGLTDHLHDFIADAVRGKLDLLSEELSQACGARGKRVLVLLSIGASQVRRDGDDGTLALEVFNGRDRRADTGVIGDGLSIQGDVHVATNENLLSLELGIGEVLDGLLGVKLDEGRSGEVADSESACTRGKLSETKIHGLTDVCRYRKKSPKDTRLQVNISDHGLGTGDLLAGAKAEVLETAAIARTAALKNFIGEMSEMRTANKVWSWSTRKYHELAALTYYDRAYMIHFTTQVILLHTTPTVRGPPRANHFRPGPERDDHGQEVEA